MFVLSVIEDGSVSFSIPGGILTFHGSWWSEYRPYILCHFLDLHSSTFIIAYPYFLGLWMARLLSVNSKVLRDLDGSIIVTTFACLLVGSE